jgi:hypothetical protein
MLSYLVEDLAFKKKEMEAFGIMQRNQVEKYVREECYNILKNVQYDQTKDSSLILYDEFSTLSQPKEYFI